MTHYPMTTDQLEVLNDDLATVMDKLLEAIALLRACDGGNEALGRAEEASAAVQRLVWAVQRLSAGPCEQIGTLQPLINAVAAGCRPKSI